MNLLFDYRVRVYSINGCARCREFASVRGRLKEILDNIYILIWYRLKGKTRKREMGTLKNADFRSGSLKRKLNWGRRTLEFCNPCFGFLSSAMLTANVSVNAKVRAKVKDLGLESKSRSVSGSRLWAVSRSRLRSRLSCKELKFIKLQFNILTIV